ncbi:MAG: DUF885 domain-containing protein [Armatimonadota bacterium]
MAKAEEAAKRLQKLSDGLLRSMWQFNPVTSTILGIHDYDHTFGDISASAFDGQAARMKGYREALECEVSPACLASELALDYRLAIILAESSHIALALSRQWSKDPGYYASLCIWGGYSLLLHDYAPLDERLHSALSRLREIPEVLAHAKENLSEIPSVFAQVGVDITQGGLGFYRNVMPRLAEQTPSLRPELLAASEVASEALERYGEWLWESVLPTAQGDFAVGGKVYQQMLFSEHYLTYTPHDLLLIAENLLAETQEKLIAVAASIDPSISWKELIAKLKLHHPPKERLEEAYREAMFAAREFVMERDLVTIPPGEQLEVTDTPEFERSTTPYAAYLPPPPFGSIRKGRFWVTPINSEADEEEQESQLLGHCTYTLPIAALHEGYPGHHLQLTRAAGITSPIRKQMLSTLLIEGWALYCEQMMQEQGFYTDPRVHLFQLKDMLWRICRVIIDIGLHTEGMSFQDAVHILVDKALLEEVNAAAEVKRYTMSPTQPMTYIIGMMLIQNMRDRVKKQLGPEFDLKIFHDRLLGYGAIPPALITEAMMIGNMRSLAGTARQDG